MIGPTSKGQGANVFENKLPEGDGVNAKIHYFNFSNFLFEHYFKSPPFYMINNRNVIPTNPIISFQWESLLVEI